MTNAIQEIQNLVKALEAGGYNAAPSTLVAGAALPINATPSSCRPSRTYPSKKSPRSWDGAGGA